MTKHKSESLADFFNSIGGEKKKLKEEKSKIIGDLSLDSLFSSMEEESRKIKEEKKQLKKDVEAFKNLLFKEEKKEEKPSVLLHLLFLPQVLEVLYTHQQRVFLLSFLL